MLTRATQCFLDQSYFKKELVIVYEDDDLVTTELFKKNSIYTHPNISLLKVASHPRYSLGNLRNIGIANAKGEFVCQWDDDDWYHQNRLSAMYNCIRRSKYQGAIMLHWLVYDLTKRKAYISNSRTWEGSILCRKEALLNTPYENKTMGEEGATIDHLLSMNSLFQIDDTPQLYIYIYHGYNTWHSDHWNYIFECSTPLSAHISIKIGEIIDGKYSVTDGSALLNRLIQNQ